MHRLRTTPRIHWQRTYGRRPVDGLILASLLFTSLAMADSHMRLYVIPPGEPPVPESAAPRDAMPDSHVGHGTRDIFQAWLTQPTARFPHGLLGDTIEAGAVRVRTWSGRDYTYVLPEDSVFEDLVPRVHDIDGDGREEVLLVRTRIRDGSSLMLLGIRDDKLVPIAESESTALIGRWINPVGVADVDGDGGMEILAVLSPHQNGTLVEYNLRSGQLVPGHRISGVTNHVAGTRAQRMSALMDANGDGITDVLIPTPDRRALRAIAFDEGRPLEFARISLPAPVLGNFEILSPSTLLVPLEDGRRVRID